jgi:hypothetical protein
MAWMLTTSTMHVRAERCGERIALEGPTKRNEIHPPRTAPI